jgi:allophanate hydrolase subunit 2
VFLNQNSIKTFVANVFRIQKPSKRLSGAFSDSEKAESKRRAMFLNQNSIKTFVANVFRIQKPSKRLSGTFSRLRNSETICAPTPQNCLKRLFCAID